MHDADPFTLPEGTRLNGMVDKEYYILETRGGGSHGYSYIAECRVGDRQEGRVFIKTPFINRNESLGAQDDKSLRVSRSFMKEYRQRDRLEGVEGVAHILDAGMTEVGNRLITFLVQDYINGDPLDNYLKNKYSSPTGGGFSGIPSQREWIDLARKLLVIFRRVHNRSVVHGDIWPPNVLMVGDDPCLVDFGQSFLLDEVPQEPGGETKEHLYLAPERVKSTTGWDVSADIYSIGGLLFYMATGMPPPNRTRDIEALKKIVQNAIRERNPQLLKENIAIAKVIDKCLRYDVVDRYPYVENIEDALEIFDYANQAGTHSAKTVSEEASDLSDTLGKLGAQAPSFFVDLAVWELRIFRQRIERMLRGYHTITAEREDLINSLLRYLGVLDAGDEYLTVTVPAFWRQENLGMNGRFLTMNRLMALKGVAIRRVFLLTEQDRHDLGVMAILQAHLEAARELHIDGVDISSKELPAKTERSYWAGYIPVEPSERQDMVTSSQHVAIWRKAEGDELVSIQFSSKPESDQIGKVRFWRSKYLREAMEEFRTTLDASLPLEDFMKPSSPLEEA
jgi:serine/threonine protein kinase